MNIFNWKKFLIFESRMYLFPQLMEILLSMKSPISEKILDLNNKDLDLIFNYLNISDKNNLISFVPDNKVKDPNIEYKFTVIPFYYVNTIKILNKFGISNVNGAFPPLGCSGYIKGTIPKPTNEFECSELGLFAFQATSDICHFVSFSGDNYVVLSETLENQDRVVGHKNSVIKIGRLVKSILSGLNITFPDSEYDKFVTEYKSKYDFIKMSFSNIEVISGEEIRKYYLLSNYETTNISTLQNSCMRHSHCQKFFDIYVKNPDVCRMVIRRSFIDDSKITARSLLWSLSNGKTMVDRIYYSKEQEQNLFEDWAISNGYYYQNKEGDFLLNGNKVSFDFSPEVELKNYKFKYYPYMDTFKFLNSENGTLYENVDRETESLCYFLDDEDGGYGDESSHNDWD